MTRLVQLQHGSTRRIALVEEPSLRLLAAEFPSVYSLAQAALASGATLTALIRRVRNHPARPCLCLLR